MHLSTLCYTLLRCRPMEPANLIGFLCNSRLFCHFALFFLLMGIHEPNQVRMAQEITIYNQAFSQILVLKYGMQLDLLNLHAESGGPRAPRSNDVSSPCSTANKLLEEMRNHCTRRWRRCWDMSLKIFSTEFHDLKVESQDLTRM